MYRYPLSIQMILPEKYREDSTFHSHLRLLKDFSFSGVELNIAHFERVNIEDVRNFLKDFDLELTMFASGLTAKRENLSLSSDEAIKREQSIGKCKEMIDFVEGTGAGIIIGFLKGNHRKELFSQSLKQIAPYATLKRVPLLIEATNRYESSIANRLEEAAFLIKDLPMTRILPDTFHMHIEETDTLDALERFAGHYASIHLSDNNRYFPGLGGIAFEEILSFLEKINYKGWIAIEAHIKNSFTDDLKRSMNYLIPLIS